MRKSSSAALPAFIKPLTNGTAGTGLHIDPHAAIPDIQHAVEECDRKHYSHKCYLISATLGTVIQVCPHVIYEQRGWFSLIPMVIYVRNSPGRFQKTNILHIFCIPLTSTVVSRFLFAFTSKQKEIFFQSYTTCPSLITDPNALHRNYGPQLEPLLELCC